MGNMLTDPARGVSRAIEGSAPAAAVQSEGCLNDPLAAAIAVTFVRQFHEDGDKLTAVEQQECVVVSAVGSDSSFID